MYKKNGTIFLQRVKTVRNCWQIQTECIFHASALTKQDVYVSTPDARHHPDRCFAPCTGR